MEHYCVHCGRVLDMVDDEIIPCPNHPHGAVAWSGAAVEKMIEETVDGLQ
jgi:predicted  nucleic acid-binding Zn-ribbon protein